jgi:protein SCO1/2
VIGLVLAVGVPAAAAGRTGLTVEPPRLVQSHALTDQHARPVLFPAGAQAWQLVIFGYTHCPDVCPMTLHKTTQLFKTLGADSERIKVVFISIDSTRDDAKAMREFVEKFDPRIVGLTGEPEALQAVANEFGILTRRFQGKTALAYTLVHSSLLYLVDPEGRVRIMYPGSIGIEAVAADLRRLWRESADPRAQAAVR